MKLIELESFRKALEVYVDFYTLSLEIKADESSASGVIFITGIPLEVFATKHKQLKQVCDMFDIIMFDNEVYFY